MSSRYLNEMLKLKCFGDSHALKVVDIPCCFNFKLRRAPDHVYRDAAILSPKNEVRVWNFRHPMEY